MSCVLYVVCTAVHQEAGHGNRNVNESQIAIHEPVNSCWQSACICCVFSAATCCIAHLSLARLIIKPDDCRWPMPLCQLLQQSADKNLGVHWSGILLLGTLTRGGHFLSGTYACKRTVVIRCSAVLPC